MPWKKQSGCGSQNAFTRAHHRLGSNPTQPLANPAANKKKRIEWTAFKAKGVWGERNAGTLPVRVSHDAQALLSFPLKRKSPEHYATPLMLNVCR